MNNPNKAYNLPYEHDGARNMWDASNMRTLNVSIEKLKHYTIASLYDSQAVWFACDVGKGNYGTDGILSTEVYDYESLFGLDFSMSKSDEISFFQGTTNHAMVFLGVDTAEGGKPVKWLVENSWGSKNGNDGYWNAYDDWFEQYVYMVIIPKHLLSDEDAKNYDKKASLQPMWDPMSRALR